MCNVKSLCCYKKKYSNNVIMVNGDKTKFLKIGNSIGRYMKYSICMYAFAISIYYVLSCFLKIEFLK